eukprot:TRINITY_DN80233_c0_g1_i1.p2 TRINITY_DN80233_c0_g1~~TRINITY_DN80233_c0_g1_i1.p2  ORF type:complete len:160 (-),score=25.23 TRINITY_DN80233_c0_g1_i1:17-496(-)
MNRRRGLDLGPWSVERRRECKLIKHLLICSIFALSLTTDRVQPCTFCTRALKCRPLPAPSLLRRHAAVMPPPPPQGGDDGDGDGKEDKRTKLEFASMDEAAEKVGKTAEGVNDISRKLNFEFRKVFGYDAAPVLAALFIGWLLVDYILKNTAFGFYLGF